MAFARLTYNIQKTNTRYETFEGRSYLVVPTISLTPGVHDGSEGPLLYLPEEISKSPEAWNHKPTMLYHPTLANGEGCSACDPEVMERQKCGLIFHANYDGRLRNETWLDESKLRQSKEGQKVLGNLNEGKMVEVSTGLFYDREDAEGDWNGEHYTGIVRNIRPDHLAVLPDQIGACSIQDGAGLLRNADGGELSHEDIREQLRGLLRCDGSPLGISSDFCYVCDVFPKYAVVEKGDKMYKVGYKVSKGKVSISKDEPEEVRKVTTYVAANNQHADKLINALNQIKDLVQKDFGPTIKAPLIANNDDSQGPLKFRPQTDSDISDILKRQKNFTAAFSAKYNGIVQEGDWGGWTTELYSNYAMFFKDNRLLRLPYTYDDDRISFDADYEEITDAAKITEYRNKNNEPLGGTTDPPPLPLGNRMSQKKLTITGEGTLLKGLLTNAIHMGAHAAFHEPDTAVNPHQGQGGDTQTRTLAGGARKKEVDSMVAAGHAKEEDRAMLESLPDDHFKSVQTFATRGAAQPIVPYSYQGIGDRSNAPAGNTAKTMTTEEWLAQTNAPPEIRQAVQNQRAQELKVRGRCMTILMNSNPNLNLKWLEAQTTENLRNLAAMAAPPKNNNQPNYGGQGDIPMFLNNNGSVTNTDPNAVQEDDDTLALPVLDFTKAS